MSETVLTAATGTDEVRRAVERYHDALTRCDVEAAVAAFTDDGVIDCTTPPDGERYEGAARIRELFRLLFDSEGERAFEIEDVFLTDDRAVVRWCNRWVDAGGRDGHVRGVDLLRVRDGKIAEKLAYVKG